MRRRTVQSDPHGVMPAELRQHPVTREEIDRWLRPGEQMPANWDIGGEAWWRLLTAHTRWADARRAWREEHDPTYWWHRSRVTERRRAGRAS